MANYYDRYSKFRLNGEIKPMPGITIPAISSDKPIVYRQGITRLDKLSDSYYNTPYCGWLIMTANAQYGGLEFRIPDNTIISVPFPFETAVDRYIQAVNTHKKLYGE